VSGPLCVSYFGRGSKTRPRSDLCASVHNFNRVCFCLNRILTFCFLFLAGSLSQYFASSLGPWENISTCELVRWSSTGDIKAPVHGRGEFARLITFVKTLLDMMYQRCPRVRHGHRGYGVGYGPLIGHGKEDVTCKVSNPPFTNLTPEVTSTKNPCSLVDFLVVQMFINEGL